MMPRPRLQTPDAPGQISLPPRAPWLGARQIFRYNRPKYIWAFGIALCIFLAAVLVPFHPITRIAGLVLAVAIVMAAGVSLLVSHIVYDRSPLHRWTWLVRQVPRSRSWLVVHAGLDEASAALRHLYPDAHATVLDIYDPAKMTEPAIRVARGTVPAPGQRTAPDRLPLPGRSVDLGVLFFAAHELRSGQDREALFAELRRTLQPTGQIVLVEHLRDAANFLAFGPGSWHFYAHREWMRVFDAARLRVRHQESITPFVRAYFLEVEA